MRCAVIDANDLVVNIIMAEPTESAPHGCVLVGIYGGVFCEIGWSWDGANFIDPNPPVVQPEPEPDPVP
jgi:hypothetical protein